MAIPTTYSFARYLAAKKSVDDRAINRHVLENCTRALSNNTAKDPLQVLEVGAGIGTMVERLLDWRILKNATYTAVDSDPDIVGEACHRLPQWATSCGYSLNGNCRERMLIKKMNRNIFVEFEAIDIADFVVREKGHRSWDLLIANAFLDLVDVPSSLPLLFSLLRPGGLFYFTINFDGVTIFRPEIDSVLDTQITTLYHRTMNQRIIAGKPSGDSCTGRHLFTNIPTCGAELLDVGSSDWVVFAGPNGYPEDEAYFLHHIIHTVDTTVKENPKVDAKLLASWTRERHAQVERRVLVYIAHQLDFLGRVLERTM